MMRIFLALLLACTLNLFLLQGVQAAQSSKVALLLEASTDNNEWFQTLAQGLQKAQEQYGISYDVLVCTDDVKAKRRLFLDAAAKYDLVLAATKPFHELLYYNAGNFPKTHFGSIDLSNKASNILSVTFADAEAAFLGGAIASLSQESPTTPLGWLSDNETPATIRMKGGFLEGARFINKEIPLEESQMLHDASSERVTETALTFFKRHIPVALTSGNASTVTQTAAQKNKAHVLLLDTGSTKNTDDSVLFAFRKRGDLAVLKIVEAFTQKTFKGREVVRLSMFNGGIEMSDEAALQRALGNRFTPEKAERIASIKQRLKEGKISVAAEPKSKSCNCL